MKRQKTLKRVRSIDQYQFQIIPLKVLFNNKQQNHYFIYIEKGAQVLGKIDEQIQSSVGQFMFRKTHCKRFRIANDKNLTYQWSLYRVTENEEQEYFQSSNFNIKNKYLEYVEEIDRFQADLYRIYIQKQKKNDLEEIWRDLRHDQTKNQFQMSCHFPKINVKINFKLKIKCQFDFLYEQWEQNREKKKLQKLLHSNRRASFDSSGKNSQNASKITAKEKFNENTKVQKPSIKKNLQNEDKNNLTVSHQQQAHTIDQLRQSQIRVTDPGGVDVTAQIPEKFLSQKRIMDEDYYYTKKKTSMLSDIIEQSYEGSSNVNLTKSNQGQRLKSVDQIREQEDTPIFSPLIKTQLYEPNLHQDYKERFKRTSTLAQKSSKQFDDYQQAPKANTRLIKQNYSSYGGGFDDEQNEVQRMIHKKSNIYIDQKEGMRSKKSSEKTQEGKYIRPIPQDVGMGSIKNIIKIIIVVAFLFFVFNAFNVFGLKNQDEPKEKIKQNKTSKKVPLKSEKQSKSK